MAIEDYEAELEQLDSEIADIDNAIALLAAGDSQLEADMRTEFAAARERLIITREKTLTHIELIRASTLH